MNLTDKEETMLEKIKIEAKSSVSFIIVIYPEEKKEREQLKEKLRKDQEIIQRLEEVNVKESFSSNTQLSGRHHWLLSASLGNDVAILLLLKPI